MKDSLSDCYLNPSESLQTINGLNYIQTGEMKTRVFQIPVIDCRKEQRVMDYKDVDHQRTKALREVTEQRTRQKLFLWIFIFNNILFFVYRSVK